MKLVYALMSVVLCVTVTSALRCYQCDNQEVAGDEGTCGDHFDTNKEEQRLTLKGCPTGSMYCKKEKKGIDGAWNRVIRSCAVDCSEMNAINVHRVLCCKGDGCNSATTATVSLFTVLLAAAASITYFI